MMRGREQRGNEGVCGVAASYSGVEEFGILTVWQNGYQPCYLIDDLCLPALTINSRL